MKLTITIMIQNKKRQDIQVNSEQKVIETLKILKQSGLIDDFDELIQMRIKSLRNGVYIDIKNNYDQEKIFTGDIIRIS